MIFSVFSRISCRFFGRQCTPSRPSTKDIRKEMQERAKKVEVEAIELRQLRRRKNDFTERVWTNTEGQR